MIRRIYSILCILILAVWGILPVFNARASALGLSLDKVFTTHQATAGTTITSPVVSTSQTNELLVAFLASDGAGTANSQSFSNISGGSLTWTLRKRTNTQPGTAEIWTAPATSQLSGVTFTATRAGKSAQGAMTIATFIGANLSAVGATNGVSASTGAPSGSLTTTAAGSWVWGVGDDYAKAVARTVGVNQTLVDQYLSPSADTYWTQRQNAPTATAGTNVTINDTAPTNDCWDLSVIEILPAVVDTTPPTTPTNVTATANSPTQVNVSWNASTDNVGVAGYSILRNGTPIATTATTTYTDTSVSPNTSYTYAVQAYDAAGNVSPASTSVAVTTPTDTTPPVISQVTASNITSSSATITWTTNEPSSSQVLYGTSATYDSSTTPDQTLTTNHSQTISGLSASTTYHYAVTSTDTYGNTATSADNNFATTTVDTTPPMVTLTAPADGSNVSGTITVAAQASDNVGVATVQFMLDGKNIGSPLTTAPYTYTWDTSTVSNGTHVLSAQAYDVAGNVGTANTVTVNVTNTPSLAPIIDPSTPGPTAVQNNVPTTTSPSFSPPANTVVYAVFSMDSASYNGNITSVTSITNTGTPLTWHLLGRNNNYSSTTGGFLEVWWAYNSTTQTNITTTATFSMNTKNVTPPVGDFQILVMDNAAVDQSAAAWNANWLVDSMNNAPTVNVTTTKANSQVFAVFDNWNNSQTPIPGANQSIQSIVLNTTDVDGYWMQRQTSPTALAGTTVTMNATDPGQANQWRALAWEVLAAN